YSLLFGKRRDELLEIVHAEGHVPGFVADHEIQELGKDRMVRLRTRRMKRRERESLEYDLHADELEIPSFVREYLVEQILEPAVHGVAETRLRLQIAVEHFDVARFVECLRRGVELRVEAGRTGCQLGGNEQRTLLTMQKLRQCPRVVVRDELKL